MVFKAKCMLNSQLDAGLQEWPLDGCREWQESHKIREIGPRGILVIGEPLVSE